MKNPILTPTPTYNFKEYTENNWIDAATRDCHKNFAETLFGEYLKQDLHMNDAFFFHFIELKYARYIDIDSSLSRLKIHFTDLELMNYCKEFKPAVTDVKDNNYIYSYKEELITVPKKTFLKKKKDFKKALEECYNNLQFPAMTFHIIELTGRTYSFYTLER